jgi:hypothetical protein
MQLWAVTGAGAHSGDSDTWCGNDGASGGASQREFWGARLALLRRELELLQARRTGRSRFEAAEAALLR